MKSVCAWLSILIITSAAYAKDVAMVTSISGNAFVFGKGFSRPLKYGSKIQDMTEVMVEDDAVITIEDYAEHTYHLTGGSHIKFFKNVVEVKAGKVWVNSRNQVNKFILQSVNGVANFQNGQFIFSFDNYSTKTQLLVMQGKVEFHNVLQSELSVEVQDGQFSLVDKDYNNSLPRTPTNMGRDSYRKMKFAFTGIDALEKVEFDSAFGGREIGKGEKGRSIASVAVVETNEKKGKVIFIPKQSSLMRNPASVDGPMKYYQEYLKSKKSTPKPVVKNRVKVRIFGGLNQTKASKTVNASAVNIPASSREPASVNAFEVVDEINSAFDKSLNEAINQNKRHSNEVNSLIDDLKSYDQTYQKNY